MPEVTAGSVPFIDVKSLKQQKERYDRLSGGPIGMSGNRQ
jgi:hypothetical protein